MQNSPRSIYLQAALGATAVCALLAAAMTLLDWLENPAGIFHGPAGTNWAFVRETALSWFVPGVLILVPVTLLLLGLYRRIRQF